MILVLNAGSSSLKYALFEGEEKRSAGAYEEISDHKAALRDLLAKLETKPQAVGHRLVHGGFEPIKIDNHSLAEIKKFLPLAPLHLPKEIALIEELQGQMEQIACFDTSFHHAMPEVAKRFPLPEFDGVRRYGFHGLSYEYIMSTLQEIPPRLIIAHLGNGASLAAVHEGKCIDTTMGFTPTGGVMMGTRSGDLDPGLLLYLMREKKMDVEALEKLVDKESGLLGVSGISSDMKVLLEKREGQLAVDLFIYQIAKSIGALTTALGGLDLLIFTAGIGERSEKIRNRILEKLQFLPPFETRAIPTDEESMIAHHARRVLRC